MGITRISNVTGLDCVGIPVAQACRPNARSVSVSQGKGLDLDAAKASAVMEAIELYHAERIASPLRLGSWRELRTSLRLAAVEGLPRISLRALDPDRSFLWIEGFDLLAAEPTWVPYEMVHMDYRLPFPTSGGCFAPGSNGLASGNHPVEATCHALYELIERDAMTLFQLLPEQEREARRLDLDTVRDPDARGLLEAYARAEVAVGVWDITTDIGLPAFRCCVKDRLDNPFRQLPMTEGAGCHAVREIALVRALTEAAQARLTFIAGSRDDIGRRRHAGHRASGREELDVRRGPADFAGCPTRETDALEDDAKFALSAVEQAGVTQAVAVDLTKSEFQISVLRLVVPGLETHVRAPGYVPGSRARRILERRKERAD
jgi:ribosomal protein S12 methylthiotransferase accessory factor